MKAWTITFRNRAWTDEDVTTAHAVAVADLIGDTWDAVSPWTGPKSLAAWLTVLLAADSGDIERAASTVYALPVDALIACLDMRAAPDGAVATAVSEPPPFEPPSAQPAIVPVTPAPPPPAAAVAVKPTMAGVG